MVVMFVAGVGVRKTGVKNESVTAEKSFPIAEPSRLEVKITEIQLKSFKTAQGRMASKVLVSWKNTGNRSVRLVQANIYGVDINRKPLLIVPSDWLIYAVPNNDPGVAPGETHVARIENEGCMLPMSTTEVAEQYPEGISVRITKVFEKDFED